MDMEKVRFFIGIDVSKRWLDIAATAQGQGILHEARCTNRPNAIQKAVAKVLRELKADKAEVLFCMEHTGDYCAPFLKEAAALGLMAWQESALRIRRSHHSRGKSDKADARRIAEYAMRFRDRARLWEPEPCRVATLRRLLALRDRLTVAAAGLGQPLRELQDLGLKDAADDIRKATEDTVKAIRAQLKKVEKQIDELVKGDESLGRNMALATSIPGIGRMNALSLILFTRNFTLFDDPKKLACYCGVAPFEHTSGSSVRGRPRVSHMANKSLKRLLHMAALSAKKCNAQIKRYYERKVAEGKNKMAVINAIRNRLIHLVMAVVKRGEPWVAKSPEAKEDFATQS